MEQLRAFGRAIRAWMIVTVVVALVAIPAVASASSAPRFAYDGRIGPLVDAVHIDALATNGTAA